MAAPPDRAGSEPITLLAPEDRNGFLGGTHYRLFEFLGAHPVTGPDGEGGYRFAVWAPRARRVSVVGDFNGWWSGAHPMRRIRGTGIWAGVVHEAEPGQRYQFRIRPRWACRELVKAEVV